jgi:hypothetical protein
MLSAIQFQEACFAAGLRLDFFFRHGDSLVTRARNDCVAYFLSYPQFTHLFWIDADIGYSPEAALRLLRLSAQARGLAVGWRAAGHDTGAVRRIVCALHGQYRQARRRCDPGD